MQAWAKDPTVLRLGNDNADVGVLQLGMRRISPELYPTDLKIDNDFGKGTRRGVMRLQQYRLLGEDGAVGEETKGAVVRCLEERWHPDDLFHHLGVNVYGPHHPFMKWLPGVSLGKLEKGKISHFGGPYDPGDRIYGQAYISGADSPRKLLEKHPELVAMGILMTEEQMLKIKQAVCSTCGHLWYPRPRELEDPDFTCPKSFLSPSPMGHGAPVVNRVIESMDKWPRVIDWKRRLKRAGTSWALNEDSFYIAMRFRRGPKVYSDHANPRLLVWSEDTGKGVVVMRSDYGPATWTGKLLDLSPGAVKVLDLRTGKRARVCYAADDAPLGPVAIAA